MMYWGKQSGPASGVWAAGIKQGIQLQQLLRPALLPRDVGGNLHSWSNSGPRQKSKGAAKQAAGMQPASAQQQPMDSCVTLQYGAAGTGLYLHCITLAVLNGTAWPGSWQGRWQAVWDSSTPI